MYADMLKVGNRIILRDGTTDIIESVEGDFLDGIHYLVRGKNNHIRAYYAGGHHREAGWPEEDAPIVYVDGTPDSRGKRAFSQDIVAVLDHDGPNSPGTYLNKERFAYGVKRRG